MPFDQVTPPARSRQLRPRSGTQRATAALPRRQNTYLLATCLLPATLLAFLLLGYHPYAEDGGIYTAALQARLHPELFPHDRVWVVAHTRFALFVPVLAAATRAFHLSPDLLLLFLQVTGLFALLAAAAHLARTCFPDGHRPWLTILLVAIGAGLPVAGTALYAVDPYCTARTLTTPLLLFALSYALRSRWRNVCLCWVAALTLHPLMAIWGALPLLLTAAFSTRYPQRWALALTFLVFAAAAVLYASAPRETAATYAVADTRAYWFPARWHWYEWVGAAAPCLLLLLRRIRGADLHHSALLRRLAVALAATTAIATALALCFARETAPSLAIARLQPMRSLHLPFIAFLATGAAALQSRLRRLPATAIVLATSALAAVSVLAMQRSLYPHTRHIEWPGAAYTNDWAEAFRWCRNNTPSDSTFALDSNYINAPGEDSLGFRAIALRSVLPDQVKDAGVAAVLPGLAPSWPAAVNATRDLSHISDSERRNRLLPLSVNLLVLPAGSHTELACPYRNSAAQVCRLR